MDSDNEETVELVVLTKTTSESDEDEEDDEISKIFRLVFTMELWRIVEQKFRNVECDWRFSLKKG